MFSNMLAKVFLSSEARALGSEFKRSKIQGAEVVGRGTIVVDGCVIASSDEFKALKDSAKRIIDAREQSAQDKQTVL